MGAEILVLVLGFALFLCAHAFASEMVRLWDEGKKAYYAGQYKEAAARWEAGLKLAKEAGDKQGAGTFLTWISAVYSDLGQYAKSLEYCQQALTIHREIGDKSGEGRDLNNFGIVYSQLGRYDKGLEYFEKALAIHREIGDSNQGPDLTNIGISYRNLGRFGEALGYLEQALAIDRGSGDRRAEGADLGSIGMVYSDIGQYKNALEYCEQALAIMREIGDRGGEGKHLVNIGVVFSNRGRFGEAVEYYEQALTINREIGDRAGEAGSLHNLGATYADFGQYRKALEHYEQALAISRQIGDRRGEAKAVGSMGVAHLALSQYERALECNEQALAMMREIEDRSGEGNVLANIGVVYLYLGQYGKALENCVQALAIQRETGNRRGEGDVLTSIGLVYSSLSQDEKALESYEQALSIMREIGNRSGEGKALTNIANVFRDPGRSAKALEYYEQALAIYREIGDRSDEGGTLTNIGVVYNRLGQYGKARETLEAGLAICNETGVPEAIWRTQRNLAEVEARLEAYKEAISHYDRAIDTIESMRAGLTDKEVKTSFIEGKLFVYDDFIKYLQALHKRDPSLGYDKKALEIFERKQGRTFLEEMGRSAASNFSGLPQDVRAMEAGLADEHSKALSALMDERSKPAQSRSNERIQNLEKRLRGIKADQEILQKEIKAHYPDYYALKYPEPASLAELQKTVLEPGELMLVYGVMKESTCLWVIGREQFGFFTLSAGEKDLEDKVIESTNATMSILKALERKESERGVIRIAQRSIKEFVQSGRKLYDLIIPDGAREIVANAGTLYIIPTGALYTIPFEALVVSEDPDTKEPHYLVQDHSVAYLSSASLLKTLRQAAARKKEKAPYPLLAFANPVYSKAMTDASSKPRTAPPSPPEDKTLAGRGASSVSSMRTRAYLDIMGGAFPELPDTEDEANEIKTLLEAPDKSLPLQLREAASRSNVFTLNDEDKLKDYRFLLFSCHGIAPDAVDPLVQPALVLSLPDPKTGKEEYLTMADAFGLKLNADLVTLSACNTGRGKVQKGEGVMGLTRAFMYAGTPAISVTLWSVESGSAKTLSTGLFRELKEGKGRAEALRDIKLSMLRGEKGDLYRHPFFWAPVVLFGDGK
jgi:tetratricopeptide (TPR) repeat protein